MEPRDILRIVLFFLIAVFAFHPSILMKIRKVSQQNIQEENEEKERQQLLQKRHTAKNRIIQEQIEYENEMPEKTTISV